MRFARFAAVGLGLGVGLASAQVVDPDSVRTDVHAANAHEASTVAVQAANVANQVASHAMDMSRHAHVALEHAKDAVAAVKTQSSTTLTAEQRASLDAAHKELAAASKQVSSGNLKDKDYKTYEAQRLEHELHARHADAAEEARLRAQLKAMRSELASDETKERAALRAKLEALRKSLEKQEAEGATLEELKVTTEKVDTLSSQEDRELWDRLLKRLDELEQNGSSTEELRSTRRQMDDGGVDADTWRKLRDLEKLLAKRKADAKKADNAELRKEVGDLIKKKANPAARGVGAAPGPHPPLNGKSGVKMTRSLDIDTAMPYGELEPFGREDTAQELTEASIRESDEMVDQIERAEVAEEKRSVFRALTRLRGAAITSFDGVARSQTGNIDEYNKSHKWRKAHPLHHLADEESDISKWAFPDNADF